MLQWFVRCPEFVEFTEILFHLGKTPMFIVGRHKAYGSVCPTKENTSTIDIILYVHIFYFAAHRYEFP